MRDLSTQDSQFCLLFPLAILRDQTLLEAGGQGTLEGVDFQPPKL
jgi:hypothetical protein